jgi:hypothetical protein
MEVSLEHAGALYCERKRVLMAAIPKMANSYMELLRHKNNKKQQKTEVGAGGGTNVRGCGWKSKGRTEYRVKEIDNSKNGQSNEERGKTINGGGRYA